MTTRACWVLITALLSTGCGTISSSPDSGSVDIDAGTSVDAGAGRPVGASCNPTVQDCQPRLSCLPPAMDGAPTAGRCFAGACDLFKQDCPEGFACGYPNVDGGARVRGCYRLRVDAGVANGTPCMSLLDCDKGQLCISNPAASTGFSCEPFCSSSRQCDGGTCALGAAYPGSQEATLYCEPPRVTCDLLTQVPCRAEQACTAIDGIGVCSRPGPVGRDGGCQFAGDCGRGDICAAGSCRPVCNVDGGDPGCGGAGCAPFSGNLAGVIGYCP